MQVKYIVLFFRPALSKAGVFSFLQFVGLGPVVRFGLTVGELAHQQAVRTLQHWCSPAPRTVKRGFYGFFSHQLPAGKKHRASLKPNLEDHLPVRPGSSERNMHPNGSAFTFQYQLIKLQVVHYPSVDPLRISQILTPDVRSLA